MKKIVLITLSTALLFLILYPSVQAKSKLKVGNVSFEGNQIYDDARLIKLMLSRPSSFMHKSYFFPEILETDIENILNFYHQNGYLEASVPEKTVIADTAQNKVDIHLSLNEGELTRVEGLSIFGNYAFDDSTLLAFVNLKKGDPFRRINIQDGMLAMISLYAEHGYLDATIKPDIRINSETHLAVVDFTVTEKVPAAISSITIEGLKETRPNVVMRELLFKEGEVIHYSALLKSQRRLYMTGLFESVFIRPVSTSDIDPAGKDILIDLNESIPSEFNASVGFGSVDKVRGRVELLTTNLAGTARKAGGAISGSFIRRAAEASFTEPYTLGTRWRTDVNMMLEYLIEPGYNFLRYGGRMTFGHYFAEKFFITVSYRHEDSRLSHIETLEQPKDFKPKIRSFIFSISRDTRDNLFNPLRGTYSEWTSEVAGTFLQGTNSFARSIVRFKIFYPFNRETVLASALEIGWIDNFRSGEEIPLNERFYAGGPNTIRGFGYQLAGPLQYDGVPLGGNFKIVWNLVEVRRTLYKIFGGVIFVDIGNVWSEAKDFSFGDIRPAAGAGIRINTPLGIVRLDYGANLDRRGSEPRDKIFFSMGQAF
ncbi:MAG: outer membrane protein assembly factor BamA [candidate division Zixibacteria bacterium HGW-Zixibacteria-1]|nr:MAG: outer membrane protein assembly factor BamA [candidate division Zixibacteria bacterium HGW-Zixibacteria-1]